MTTLLRHLLYMVSVFFYCHNLCMDMEKFYKLLMGREDIGGIPLDHVLKVVVCVFEIINSGECFYKEE